VDPPSLSYGRLVANVLAGAGSRAAAIATALVLATVLVHTLGLTAYGTWSFFFVLIGYHGQFDLGLSVAVERAVARAAVTGDAARLDALLNTGVALTLGVAAMLQLLALLPIPDGWLARVGDPAAVRRCVLALPFCLACSNVAAVAGAGLTGLQRTTTLAAQRTIIGAATAIVVMGLAAAGGRLDQLLVAYALGLLATAGASWRAVGHAVGGVAIAPWRATGSAMRELAVVGGTLQATHLVAQAGDQGLRLILGSAFGAAAIGIYDLGSRAAIVPRSLMASLLVALVPFAAAREGSTGQPLSDTLQRSTRYATLAIAVGTLAGLFVSGPFMALWLGGAGSATLDAQLILQLLLVALAVQSVTSPMVALARAAGRPGAEAIATTVAQPLALIAAAQASALAPAVAAYAVVTTLASLILWSWLKRALGLAGLSGRDVGAIAVVTAGTALAAAAARVVADTLAVGPWLTLAIVPVAASLAATAIAVLSGAVPADERRRLAGIASGR
jgi:O-antigen/teichoic acid export membrane protein